MIARSTSVFEARKMQIPQGNNEIFHKIISTQGISMDEDAVETVRNWS